MMFVIDIEDLNSQSLEVNLDGTIFYIILDWNDSGKYWTMGIRNSAYETLINGISLVVNYPLTWQFRYQDMPSGELLVGSAGGKPTSGPIPRNGFTSGKYVLVYQTYDELVAQGLMPDYGETSPIVV